MYLDLKTVTERMAEEPVRAFVHVCSYCQEVIADFLESEASWDDDAAVELRIRAIRQVLDGGDAEELDPLEGPRDLVPLLTALDRWLRDNIVDSDWPGNSVCRSWSTTVEKAGRKEWYFPVRRPEDWRPRGESKFRSIRSWVRGHWVIQEYQHGLRVKVKRLKGIAKERLRQVLTAGVVPIAATGFDDGVELVMSQGVIRGLDDPDRRRQSLEDAVERARDASVLVLPELTVPRDLREELRQHMQQSETGIGLCLVGSFHIEDGGNVYNESLLIGPDGRSVATQRKLFAYGNREPRGPGEPDEGVRERIQPGRVIELVSTPLGLMAIAICRDFFEGALEPLWRQVGVEWFLVPSMGCRKTTTAHVERARALCGDHGAVVVAAVQPFPGTRYPSPGDLYPEDEACYAVRCLGGPDNSSLRRGSVPTEGLRTLRANLAIDL